ncbi:MAG: hypothetical protein MSH60_06120 [Ruminococcus sp.]|nr:hypothetical protein [Ruminococcus sp.]
MTAFDYIISGLPDDFVCEDYSDMYMVVGNITDWLGNRSVKLLNRLVPEDNSYLDKSGNTCYIFSKEYADKLKSIEVTFDEKTEDYSGTRRPYYQLRGKPVSAEQAVEFIRRADSAFADFEYPKSAQPFYLINMCSDVFSNSSSNGLVHPNGIVGMNGIMGKYPDFYELFEEFVSMAMEFPFLDFVAAVTYWNEMPSWEWEKLSDDNYEKPTYYPDFTECLEIGVWVHDSKAEFLSPKNAAKKYKEYEKLYGEAYGKIYCDKRNGEPNLADFFAKCLEANGIIDE